MPVITVESADPASQEARDLIAQLDAYQESLYPPESNHLLSTEALRQSNVTFLLLRVDGRAAGCGAVVNQDGAYAEIKRMYVLPEYRGLRMGRRILSELESACRAAGLTLARLETGIAQPEALALYERSGYVRRGPFGDYVEDPLSVFMEKRLT